MFNFFKKSKEVEEVKIEVVETILPEDNSQIIDSAHIQKDITLTFANVLEQFNLKSTKEGEIEILKAQLEEYKEANDSIYKKIDSLKNLGFVNTPTAKTSLEKLKIKEEEFKLKISAIEKQIKLTKKIKELTDMYALKYPTFKFVDNNTMISIMKKYSLVMGEAFTYCKEIPDRALGIIESFSGEIKESKTFVGIYREYSRGYSFGRSYQIKQRGSIKQLKKEECNEEYYSEYLTGVFEITGLKMIAPFSHFELPNECEFDGRCEYFEAPIIKLNKDTRKLEFNVDEVNEIERQKEVLDPIACLEVKGGYIILDAWDEEADIPEIQNPMIN